MTIVEIVQQVLDEYGTRNQITQTQALRYLNTVQELAFSQAKLAFLEYSQFVSVVTDQLTYSFPTVPACREFVGVTQATPQIILGVRGNSATEEETDYEFESGVPHRRIYETAVVDVFRRTFTFVETPSEVANTYRMVYYRGAPLISTTTDDTNLLIPLEYHWSLVIQGMINLADNDIYGEKAPMEVLEPLMKDFWAYLDKTMDDGNREQYINQGQPLA